MKKHALKTTRFAVLLASACLIFATTSLHASDSNYGGFYVDLDAGLNLMDKMPIGSIFSYQGFSGVYIPKSSTGFRFDFPMGYAFKLSDQLTLGPELETGISYNSVSFLGDNFELAQVPILVNLALHWHFHPHWVAYVGAGGGLDLLLADDDTGITSSSESDFAWQVKGGVQYKFGGSSAFGLGVKYLSLTPSGEPRLGNTGIFASYSVNF